VDLRYAGQSFDLGVTVPEDLGPDDLPGLADQFHERHRERYGHASPDEPIELVTVRLRARGVVETPDLVAGSGGTSLGDARREERPVTFEGETRETPIYEREALPRNRPSRARR
jgi:N-methylhydantoinase A